jgi:pilus assembly protein CpaF
MQTEVFRKIENIYSKQKDDFKYDWKKDLSKSELPLQKRIENELYAYGPLNELIADNEITEILVNDYQNIFYEKSGKLFTHPDHFFSTQTYEAVLDRLAQNCGTYLNREKPFVEAQFKDLRISIVSGELSRGSHILSIRKKPAQPWTLSKLKELNFLTDKQLKIIIKILTQNKNFLVVGNTSSGKTSFLQALLSELPKNERVVIIEDTQELTLPNNTGVSLLTRQDPTQSVGNVNMQDLLTRALRLRPDRLVVGEIRGEEARSLLMTLSTGHDGSFGSLHAKSPQEALLRLEMLIQMNSNWNINSIRNLIALSLQNIIVLEKFNGIRRLKAIYEMNSLESMGFTFTRLDENEY